MRMKAVLLGALFLIVSECQIILLKVTLLLKAARSLGPKRTLQILHCCSIFVSFGSFNIFSSSACSFNLKLVPWGLSS